MAQPSFEIGLVGAGAVSAGAYTGGVVDFLVQALDEWHAAPDSGGVPPHAVRLSVFSGASAGAMTAAIAAGTLASDQPPVTSEAEARANAGRNKLYDCWVDRIDIAALLGSRDLARGRKVVSLLDSTVLDAIAADGLDIAPRAARRPWVADDFSLLLTVTNLRGVPYEIPLLGARDAGYGMSLHADHVHFALADGTPAELADRCALAWRDLGAAQHPMKARLIATALASGAFPVGFAPRALSHVIPGRGRPDPYEARPWPVPTPESHDPHACTTDTRIPVAWGELPDGYRYDYLCVDGGVMDNEPLELARRRLAGGNARNERAGDRATRAVVLIDPFPGEAGFDARYTPPRDLLGLVTGLFDALKNQARFKPEELVLALDPEVNSRFLIAPVRGSSRHPIACGALGGFGGFLKREFRAHDWFLGRRNAQKFFRDHFVLPESNPLFADWPAALKAQHCVRDAKGIPQTRAGQRLLPIVPVVGAAARECAAAAWPRYTPDDLAALRERLATRVDAVIDGLVDQYFDTNNIFIRWGAAFFLRRKKEDIVQFIEDKVSTELKAMGLLET